MEFFHLHHPLAPQICYLHKLTTPNSDPRLSWNPSPNKTSQASALLKRCMATVRDKCARFPRLRGRLITFSPRLRIRSGQVDMRVRYPGRGKNASGARLRLVSGLWCLLENGNCKNFSQHFLSKLSFDKLSWVFAFCLQKFFGFLSKLVF